MTTQFVYTPLPRIEMNVTALGFELRIETRAPRLLNPLGASFQHLPMHQRVVGVLGAASPLSIWFSPGPPPASSAGNGIDQFLEAVMAGKVWSRKLRDDTSTDLRLLRQEDQATVQEFLKSLPDSTLEARFGRPLVSPADIERFTDCENTTTLLAAVDGKPVALADRRSADKPGVAGIGIVVAHGYQGKGLGSLLLSEMAAISKAQGLVELSDVVLRSNYRALGLSKKLGASTGPCRDDPRYLTLSLPLTSPRIELFPVVPQAMRDPPPPESNVTHASLEAVLPSVFRLERDDDNPSF